MSPFCHSLLSARASSQYRSDSLPPLTDQLGSVKLRNPIEQHMFGHGGLFRQQNIEKRRIFSVREWAELCSKDDRRAPGADSVDLRHARRAAPPPPPKSRAKRGERTRGDSIKADFAGPVPVPVLDKVDDAVTSKTETVPKSPNTPPLDGDSKISTPPVVADLSPADPQSEQPADVASLPTPERSREEESDDDGQDSKPQQAKAKRKWQTREMREAHLAERAAADAIFLKSFNPKTDWLPPHTRPEDYTPEFCRTLERQYWRNCGFGTPAMYGADMEGCILSNHFISSRLTKSFRLSIHESNQVLERCSPTISTKPPHSKFVKRPSRGEYAIPLLRHVASDFRVARRRYGSI